jgi:hypothetical protein
VSKVGVAYANIDHGGGRVTADLDTLLIALTYWRTTSCRAGRVQDAAH